jgi:hypothetical protein
MWIMKRCGRSRVIPSVFLLILAVGTFSTGASAGGASVSAYDGSLGFAAQLLRLQDGCLSVDGKVTSGGFFDGLKRKDIRGRLEYRKGGRSVADYPESLTASIRILGDRCAGTLSTSPSIVFGDNSYAMKFVVQWKDGMQLSPAKLSPVVAQCVGSSTLVILASNQNFTVPSVTCQMTVDSKDVPLRDHLIVSVFGADGTRLTRLSAGP